VISSGRGVKRTKTCRSRTRVGACLQVSVPAGHQVEDARQRILGVDVAGQALLHLVLLGLRAHEREKKKHE
jgi:hypothetical protein